MQNFDELWTGGPRFKRGALPALSTDSVLLADFADIKKNSRCLDLGSGAGVLCVLIAAKCEGARLTGIELQSDFAETSRENLRVNGYAERAEIICADLRGYRTLVAAESFDHVVTNPPYFAEKSGYAAPDERRAASRDERSCSLSDVCAAARWALRWGGTFFLVHRPERLSEIFCAMTAAGIEPKRLRFVQYTADRAPNLVLIEGRRGGSPGLSVEPPLILTKTDGGDSDEAQRIYRCEKYSAEKNSGEDNL